MTINKTIKKINMKYETNERPLQCVTKCARCGKTFFKFVGSAATLCDECLYEARYNDDAQQKKAQTKYSRDNKKSPYLTTTRDDGSKTYLHRAIMEAELGRRLDADEVVHHIDGNKHNNNIDNLRLMSRSEHVRLHAMMRKHSK